MNADSVSLSTEEFRPIPGFEGLYSVSNAGNVRRDAPTRGFGSRAEPGRIMKQKRCADGYRSVSIYPAEGKQKQIHVHRLVALAFIPAVEGKPYVNHKNGNKADNRVENLEWVTAAENIQHAYATNLIRVPKGSERFNAVLNEEAASAMRLLARTHGWSIASLARAFRVDTSRVSRILMNEIWVAN